MSTAKNIVDASKKPKSKAEALALLRYLIETEVKPLLAELIDEIILACPPNLQPEIKTAILLAEDLLESPTIKCWK